MSRLTRDVPDRDSAWTPDHQWRPSPGHTIPLLMASRRRVHSLQYTSVCRHWRSSRGHADRTIWRASQRFDVSRQSGPDG